MKSVLVACALGILLGLLIHFVVGVLKEGLGLYLLAGLFCGMLGSLGGLIMARSYR